MLQPNLYKSKSTKNYILQRDVKVKKRLFNTFQIMSTKLSSYHALWQVLINKFDYSCSHFTIHYTQQNQCQSQTKLCTNTQGSEMKIDGTEIDLSYDVKCGENNVT